MPNFTISWIISSVESSSNYILWEYPRCVFSESTEIGKNKMGHKKMCINWHIFENCIMEYYQSEYICKTTQITKGNNWTRNTMETRVSVWTEKYSVKNIISYDFAAVLRIQYDTERLLNHFNIVFFLEDQAFLNVDIIFLSSYLLVKIYMKVLLLSSI